MKKLFIMLILITAIFAEMPNTIAYRGQLTDETCNALDAAVGITFNIFDVATGGTSLWSETQSVSVTDGFFDIELGSVTALDLNFDSQYWVELTIGTETLSPRDKLTPTAYSIRSNIANKADSTLYSVSSSADHSGRIGHVRFIPGEGGIITEAAASSETDTIYIAIGGGTGGAESSSYPMGNKAIGHTQRSSTDVLNQILYTVPTGRVFYIYAAELSNIPTSSSGYAFNYLTFNDGYGDQQFIHASGDSYNDLASTPAVIHYNPPIRLEQGSTINYTFDTYSSYYFIHGYMVYGWEGTE